VLCYGSQPEWILSIHKNRPYDEDRSGFWIIIGSQYAGGDYRVAESFFHSLKTEWTSGMLYRNRSEARSDVIHYIEMFYNSHRLHSYLKYKNPNDFEKSFMLAKTA
jgi:transposase InsO family protein